MKHKPLTVDHLRKILSDRGFSVAIGADGRPVLRGKVAEATPALMRVVAMYREELVSELKGAKS